MITTLFLLFVSAFLSLLLAVLPSVSGLPSGVEDAVTFVSGHIGAISGWFPVDTVLLLVGLTLGFEAGMIIFWSVNWILNKLRGSG